MPAVRPKAALILTGSGARAAYEAGVLKAIAELMPATATSPFPIVCGASAGAINAVLLAASAKNFDEGVGRLEGFWADMRCAEVFRPTAKNHPWLVRMLGQPAGIPDALFDLAPLHRRLEGAIDFLGIEQAIAEHVLHAIGVGCAGLVSGEDVCFFQGRADLDPWRSGRRAGAHVALGADHLLASFSLPLLFPPVRLHREWFGNGLLRRGALLASATRLGAERALIVAAEPAEEPVERGGDTVEPGAGWILGQVLARTLFDVSAPDIAAPSSPSQLVICPSRPLEDLASEHAADLPEEVVGALIGRGARAKVDSLVASLLLFESVFTRALIDLGYRDARARDDDIRAFLS